ncbi:hypothetical protein HN446_02870 [bacterium]|jgi:hypothetical protein|nr:hypothetical protein [bacterium]
MNKKFICLLFLLTGCFFVASAMDVSCGLCVVHIPVSYGEKTLAIGSRVLFKTAEAIAEENGLKRVAFCPGLETFLIDKGYRMAAAELCRLRKLCESEPTMVMPVLSQRGLCSCVYYVDDVDADYFLEEQGKLIPKDLFQQ